MNDSFNRNENQTVFNQVRGIISELNDAEKFCSITLSVGQHSIRNVNFIIMKPEFDRLRDKLGINDKVTISFYVSSKYKHGKWYTTAVVIGWEA